MKFTCPQQTLAKALNVVSKAITNRTTIPILKGILLEADHGQLTLTASDLELSIETKIDVQVAEEGSLVIALDTTFRALASVCCGQVNFMGLPPYF